MRRALELAAQGEGDTAPNPRVGAILVRGGEIVAEGWHQRYGGPHAEVNCLADAAAKGVAPSECVMYVTLEPCNHYGKTPPCSKAVYEAGIRKVFVGCADPNPHVEGGGADFLRERGVDVTVGVLERECLDMIADFRLWQATRRAYLILKMAATLDGKIAARTGHSAYVSCPASLARVQKLRRMCGAVLVGGGTFRTDDPRLTVRGKDGKPEGRQPLAVVATQSLPRAGEDRHLLRERPQETIFWTDAVSATSDAADGLREAGVRIWDLGPRGAMDFGLGLTRLRQECGCHHVLCEGGGGLAMSLLARDLMDEMRLFLAPKVLGDETAVSLFSGRALETMTEALRLRFAGVRPSGDDLLLTLRPAGDERFTLPEKPLE